MAGPIAHIYLALQILAGPFQGLYDEREFLIGTSFPDIRYLKCIEGSKTHYKNVTLGTIKQEKNSFKAGLLFHSFVDEQREKYVEENHFYEKLPNFRFVSQSLKFAEDQILMTLFNVEHYRSYFDKLLPEEQQYKISDKYLVNWHNFLKDYLSKKLSTYDLTMKYFDLHEPNAWFFIRWFFAWYYAWRINSVVNNILHNQEFQNIKELIMKFYLNFTHNVE